MTENAIRLERRYSNPTESVGRTDYPGTACPLVGAGRYRAGRRPPLHHGHGLWGQQRCEVLTVDPGTSISFLFSEGMLDTTITWRLEPVEGGTILPHEHAGFRLDTPMGKQAIEGMGNGWPGLLEQIDGVLAGVS